MPRHTPRHTPRRRYEYVNITLPSDLFTTDDETTNYNDFCSYAINRARTDGFRTYRAPADYAITRVTPQGEDTIYRVRRVS